MFYLSNKNKMRWFTMKESRTLEAWVFFFLFLPFPRSAGVCYRKCCRFLLPQQSFSKWKKDRGGGAWVYPPRRVSQPFIFGEFSLNWVLKKSKWKREREKRSKQIRHEKDCKKTMPLVFQFFFLSHSYANWPRNGSKRKIWSEMSDGTGV